MRVRGREICEDTFGGRLHAARCRAGLSQAQIVQRLGVSAPLYQRWENDVLQPRSHHLVALARAFRVSLDYLLLGRSACVECPLHRAVGQAWQVLGRAQVEAPMDGRL